MTTATATKNDVLLPAVKIGLQINSITDLREFCAIMAKTNMVPKAYIARPDDILVSVLHGQEVGLPPLQALQSIACINGVPSIYGDAGLALVRSSGKLADFDEWFEVDGVRQEGSFDIVKAVQEGKKVVAFCYSLRVGMSKGRKTWFSVDDAKRAHLWMKKGNSGQDTPWVTYPDRMLAWRARGWNLRDNFGDVLKGLAIYEEALDLEPIGHHEYAMPREAGTPENGSAGPEPPKGNGQAKGDAILGKLKKPGTTIDITPPATAAPATEPENTQDAPPASPTPETPTEPQPPSQPDAAGTTADEAFAKAQQEAAALVSTLASTNKGQAILNAIRKDCKLPPDQVVPADPQVLAMFLKAAKAATKKLGG